MPAAALANGQPHEGVAEKGRGHRSQQDGALCRDCVGRVREGEAGDEDRYVRVVYTQDKDTIRQTFYMNDAMTGVVCVKNDNK